jgi:hypothetical protein
MPCHMMMQDANVPLTHTQQQHKQPSGLPTNQLRNSQHPSHYKRRNTHTQSCSCFNSSLLQQLCSRSQLQAPTTARYTLRHTSTKRGHTSPHTPHTSSKCTQLPSQSHTQCPPDPTHPLMVHKIVMYTTHRQCHQLAALPLTRTVPEHTSKFLTCTQVCQCTRWLLVVPPAAELYC